MRIIVVLTCNTHQNISLISYADTQVHHGPHQLPVPLEEVRKPLSAGRTFLLQWMWSSQQASRLPTGLVASVPSPPGDGSDARGWANVSPPWLRSPVFQRRHYFYWQPHGHTFQGPHKSVFTYDRITSSSGFSSGVMSMQFSHWGHFYHKPSCLLMHLTHCLHQVSRGTRSES